MNDATVQGLVYLALTIGAICLIVIVILAILLHRARAEAARLQGELVAAEQRIFLADERARIEGSGDADLAGSLGDALRGVRGP